MSRSVDGGARRPNPKAAASGHARGGWLRGLNLFGLDHLDAVLLAALASEAPLLLIGPHGSAKSALLERVARALALEHRHYNASLVSFDDLLGFPVPNAARDGLDYLRTPATLWGAQSVFLDEISRCRPEVQNKLFSIVHERRALGVELTQLRYRWAAMNPPAAFDADGELEDAYLGSQPLDPALADRFVFVVSLPALQELTPEDRRALIARGDEPLSGDAGLARLEQAARERAQLSREAHDAWVVGYVEALCGLLAQAKLPVSGRRAAMLRRAVHAVQGAREAMHAAVAPAAIEDSALQALRWGLPQRAQGREPAESKLLAIHRQAVDMAASAADSPLRRLQAEPDPVRRIAMALALPPDALSKTAFSALVADAFAAQDLPGRYLLARRLLGPLADRDAVNAPTLEMLAEPMGKVLDFEHEPAHKVNMTRSVVARFNALLAVVARLNHHDANQASLANVLYTLFAVEKATFDAQQVVERDAEIALRLGQGEPA
jgi:MoxR-like ATPase